MNSKPNVKNESKKLTIITIATVIILVIIFAGVTYAFFTANNPEGSTAQIISETGRMLITYNDGTDNIVPVTNIQPSNAILVNKTFTLTGLNTTTAGDGLAMEYKVGLKYTSSFSDGQIHYYIKKVSSTSDTITTEFTGEANQTVPGNETYTGYSHGTLKNGNNKYTEMVTGEFPANEDEQTITFNLKLQFPDTGENQDTEKGKAINAEVVVNYEPETMVKTLNTLYSTSSKDENGITVDGLQKDGTGDFNVTLLDNSNKDYKVTLLNDSKLIADSEYDEYDNLRYVGATPNNYVSFNNETWRIIGIFNVYNNDTNKNEKLIKIIRNDSLGWYSWDTSDSSINTGQGINEWSQADLMTELNTDYINPSPTSTTTLWFTGSNNSKNGTYDYSKNIKSAYIDKIANVRWNLGSTFFGDNAINTYKLERGTIHVSDPADGVTRTDYWNGKVGLMYPSDYAYATIDTICRSNLSLTNCKNNNWLFNQSMYWVLSSVRETSTGVFHIDSTGYVSKCPASFNRDVRPALFLKSDTQITSGTGTESDPYIIE